MEFESKIISRQIGDLLYASGLNGSDFIVDFWGSKFIIEL